MTYSFASPDIAPAETPQFQNSIPSTSKLAQATTSQQSTMQQQQQQQPAPPPQQQRQQPQFVSFAEPLPVSEPFQAAITYSDLLGPAAEPGVVLDFASWNQTELLFSLGLVSHAAHDATAAWFPPPNTDQAQPAITAAIQPSGLATAQSVPHPSNRPENRTPIHTGPSTGPRASNELQQGVTDTSIGERSLPTGLTPATTPGGTEHGWSSFPQPFPPTDLVDLWMSRGDLGFGIMDQAD